MSIDEVTQWFGNLNQACKALKIASQNMTRWKEQGYIPWKQQFKIAMITEGELMPDDEDPCLVRNPKKPKLKKRKSNAKEMEISRISTISSDFDSM